MKNLKKYEAPFAEITEIKMEAIMAWSGIHQTDPSDAPIETTEFFDDDEP